MCTSPALDIDRSVFADWLATKGANRLWNVDGEARLAGILRLPCTGQELADSLRAQGRGRLRLFAPEGQTPVSQDIADYADVEDGAQVFEVAWLEGSAPGAHWVIAEDELAEEAERLAAQG